MTFLIFGLILFLSAHSVRIFADDWRTRQIARVGENAWMGLIALVSLVGFVLIIWGYDLAREVCRCGNHRFGRAIWQPC